MSRPTRNYTFTAPHQSLELPALPHVSRLYSLPPIGVGTGFVECLTSYLARLAQAHRVTPSQLFTKEILPLMNQVPLESRIGRFNSIFGGYNRFFNGLGKPAAFLTAALEQLTLRSDLGSLSMLRWHRAISGVSQSKPIQAWCAQCFSDWQQEGKVIFQPLLWTISLVSYCTVHNSPLTTECPSCSRRSAPVEGLLKIGTCAKCGAWLGQSPSRAPIETRIDDKLEPVFVSKQLFDALEFVAEAVAQHVVAARLEGLLRNRGWSSVSAFALAAKIPRAQFCTLKYQHYRTPLKTLLRVCQTAQIDLKELLSEKAIVQSTPPTTFPKFCPRMGKWKDKAFLKAVRSALEAAFAEPCPTPLHRIAAEFQCANTELQQHFPHLSKQLTVKRRAYRRRKQRRLILLLAKALAEREHLSIRALGKLLGVSVAFLYDNFPQEVAQLSARNRSFKEQAAIAKKNATADMIRQAAHQLHGQGEYPSVRRVLRQLGWKRNREIDDLVRSLLANVRTELGIAERCVGWNDARRKL